MSIRPVIANIYLWIVEAARGIPYSQTIRQARANVKKSYDALFEEQSASATDIIMHAYATTQGYREKYANVFAEMHEPLHLLKKLPLLEKSELVLDPSQYISSQPRGKVFFGSTSGSTGKSLRFAYDATHLAWSEACKWRGRNWYGVKRGDHSLILWGRPIGRKGYTKFASSVKSWIRNERHFDTFGSLDDEFLVKVIDYIKKRSVKYVYGYGSSLSALSSVAANQGLVLSNDSGPVLIQYTADHMGATERALAETSFGSRVVSDYGASELPGIAEECELGFLHISMDHCVVEVLSQDLSPVVFGEVGELVVTALNNYAMPLIRYRVGDIGRMIGGACECGLPFPRMELVAGKAVDLISTSFASSVSAHYLDYINIQLMNRGDHGISQFQVIQKDVDDFELRYIAGVGNTDDSVEKFCSLMRERLGSVRIECSRVSAIEVSTSGKRKYFIKRELSETENGFLR